MRSLRSPYRESVEEPDSLALFGRRAFVARTLSRHSPDSFATQLRPRAASAPLARNHALQLRPQVP